ncbi:hypothetical protein [Brachyspira aalborgi]|mgnify:FL=1|jgi:hypothetical protein|uniref:ImmA/IrrE family metallo-endopeptidase n=1 Tax=Brachyspira aalborgi TaxID=29522 RepID=A0A5C8G7U3_9SPIR|nr:hypothetical protein [Brachyspira aalborgi]MBS4762717.1 hypothetical protein [Brachyspira sp.]CCY75276.1 putative uncharacterized protein [Brachyspira sp. CAG:700]TXJ34604.1 hypothetical protein EPJ71_01730 [Brachyspira aalborgi]TXJ46073.1 hypothetical protein EPJ65_00920 [Brachyspira aalborgi]TXJ52410.1 hypothetical protein EPJ75_00540 [Brachyspira aalborgi]
MNTTTKQDCEFKFDKEVRDIMKKYFKLQDKTVNRIFNYYEKDIRDAIKGSYLAHYIRSLEQKLKEYTKNPLFSIIVRPLPSNSKNLNIGVARYYHNRYVIIYYHPKMDEIQLRDCLAHEIGHIFLCNFFPDGLKPDECLTEPLASILGILFMIDINDFYKQRCKKYSKREYNEIVEDFIDINKRKRKLKNKK